MSCAPPSTTTSGRPKPTYGGSRPASTSAAPRRPGSRTPRSGSEHSTGVSSSPPNPTPRPSSPASPTRSRTSRSPPTSCCCGSPAGPATGRPSPWPSRSSPRSARRLRPSPTSGRSQWRSPSARAAGKGVEVEALERVAEALLEPVPELQLAADPGRQDLQLEDPAERRVAAQLAVQLQPPEALADAGERGFERFAVDPEPVHQPDQRLPVGFDLGADPRQRLAHLAVAAVARPQAAGQLDAERGPRQMVVEVDGQQAVGARARRHRLAQDSW